MLSSLAAWLGGGSSTGSGGSARYAASGRAPPSPARASSFAPPYSHYGGGPAATMSTDMFAGASAPRRGAPAGYALPRPGPASRANSLAALAPPAVAEADTAVDVDDPLAASGHPPPPPALSWARIRAWAEEQYPEVCDTFNTPATDEDIEDIERAMGRAVPASVRASLLCVNGQDVEAYATSVPGGSCTDGLFFGLPMLSAEQALREWSFWRQVDKDPDTGASPAVRANMSSCPAGWVRVAYSDPAWLPLITDRVGNYIGVDLNPPGTEDSDLETRYDRPSPRPSTSSDAPGNRAAAGQVIAFGRDFDTKVVLCPGDGPDGWAHFLRWFADELEAGQLYTLDASELVDSDAEEDLIGYEGYFSGSAHGAGASGRGGGETAGDGLAGFALKGDYAGWPTLEAMADRSARIWDEAGYAAGTPANQMPDYRPEEDVTDEKASKRLSQYPYLPPTLLVQRPEEEEEEEEEKPLGGGAPVPVPDENGHVETMLTSPSTTGPGENVHTLVSPPSVSSPTGSGSGKRRPPPPPAPSALLDLPTLADVKAAEAAALAQLARGQSQQHQLDLGPDVSLRDPYRMPTYTPRQGQGLALSIPLDSPSGLASPSEAGTPRVVAYAPRLGRDATASPVPPFPGREAEGDESLPLTPALPIGPLGPSPS